MPKNDIGGFFVSLGLNIDKNSWETGNRIIDGMGNSLNKLIGTARNAAVVLAGTAIATGTVESTAYKTSVALGVTTEALDLWKASAKIAGVDANGLIGSMGQLANVMNHMKIDGSGLEQFSKKLGELGIVTDKVDIAKMLEMSPDELMKEIISKAQEAVKNGNGLTQVSTIVGDILGESGMNFFIELQRQGKTIDEFLAGAGSTVFTNSASNAKAADFAVQIGTLKTELESITKLLGSEVGGVMTPYIKTINDFIVDNKSEIISGIKKTAEATEKIVGKFVEITAMLTPFIAAGMRQWGGDVNQILTGLGQILQGEVGAGVKTMSLGGNFDQALDSATGNGMGKATAAVTVGSRTIPGYGSLVHGTDWVMNKLGFMSDEEYNAFWANGGYVDQARGKKMKDGIMRPDGTVTQVAPDDWVFAARNLGDLARAFIPQNYTAAAAPSEYVINQTFNINGGNDMPQVLRQQAYRGTQEGLLEIMNQSSQRMQLMSGTR